MTLNSLVKCSSRLDQRH